MAATPSTMIALGTAMPAFTLPDPTGRMHDSSAYATAPATLVMFICNHCPFVKHIADELAALGRDYQGKGAAVIAISSNDAATHPDDAPDKMAEEATQRGYTFPYLYDESQDVARAFDAACTPDFFVYDGEGKLAYRGQLDDSRPSTDAPVTGADLRAALDAVLAGAPVPAEQRPSIGCNIKWRSSA